MNIPFRVKTLTKTAKAPTQENQGDLWDLYADNFCVNHIQDLFVDGNNEDFYSSFKYSSLEVEDAYTAEIYEYNKTLVNTSKNELGIVLHPQGRILVKTGISLELPVKYHKYKKNNVVVMSDNQEKEYYSDWNYSKPKYKNIIDSKLDYYIVADIRPRSGLALKQGITVLNTPGTIDNSYRKEIGVILYNAGHEPYTINKGDKIAQMLIRPLYPSQMEIVDNINDTGRGGYGSTGK